MKTTRGQLILAMIAIAFLFFLKTTVAEFMRAGILFEPWLWVAAMPGMVPRLLLGALCLLIPLYILVEHTLPALRRK